MFLLQQYYEKLRSIMKILMEIGCFRAEISSGQFIFMPFCSKSEESRQPQCPVEKEKVNIGQI